MLIVALVLAVIGLAALVTAVVTSNELVAWVCIGSSVLGVILLIIDAIRERTRAEAGLAPADASAGGTFNAENADEAIPAEAAIAEGATMDDPEEPVEAIAEPAADEAEAVQETAAAPVASTEEQSSDEVPSQQAEAVEADEVEAQEAEAAADEASADAADEVAAAVDDVAADEAAVDEVAADADVAAADADAVAEDAPRDENVADSDEPSAK